MAEKKSKLVEIKTKPTNNNVVAFINKISDEQKRKDCFVLIDTQLLVLAIKDIKVPIPGGKLTGYSLALHRVKQIYRFM